MFREYIQQQVKSGSFKQFGRTDHGTGGGGMPRCKATSAAYDAKEPGVVFLSYAWPSTTPAVKRILMARPL